MNTYLVEETINIVKEGFLKGLHRLEGWQVSSLHCLGTSCIFGIEFRLESITAFSAVTIAEA